VISPLMRIEPLAVAPELSRYGGVIFTSGSAVPLAGNIPAGLPAYCVGARTARVAAAAGFVAVSAGGNAADLVRLILARAPEGPLLHLRGEHATSGVAAALTRAGVPTDELVVYHQLPKDLNDKARAVLAGPSPVILPLFSPRSAALFAEKGRDSAAPLRIIALSEAVAKRIRGRFPGEILVAARPDADHMLDLVTGLMAA